MMEGAQLVLILLGGVGGFCAQWFHTSKGVDTDPKTGKVVIIAQPVTMVMTPGPAASAFMGVHAGDNSEYVPMTKASAEV